MILPLLSLTLAGLTRGATQQERTLLQGGILGKIPLPKLLGGVDGIVGKTAMDIMRKVEGGLR